MAWTTSLGSRATPARALLLLGLAALSACGGGDAGDPPAAADSPQAAADSPQTAADAGTGGGPAASAFSGDCGMADFAARALAAINQRRTAGASCGSQGSFAPAAALRWNDRLAQAAAGHAADMASRNYFSHTSADGRTMTDRVNATGYAWGRLGENIAAGYPDIEAVIAGWMRSDGHCANLMNPAFDEVGLACADGSGSAYGRYWTQNLARAR